jgi:hypothetical protein
VPVLTHCRLQTLLWKTAEVPRSSCRYRLIALVFLACSRCVVCLISTSIRSLILSEWILLALVRRPACAANESAISIPFQIGTKMVVRLDTAKVCTLLCCFLSVMMDSKHYGIKGVCSSRKTLVPLLTHPPMSFALATLRSHHLAI